MKILDLKKTSIIIAIAIQIGTFGVALYSALKAERNKQKAFNDTSVIYDELRKQVTTLQEWAKRLG